MFVCTRTSRNKIKPGEPTAKSILSLYTSDGVITIQVVHSIAGKARLGVDAPPNVKILRSELEKE